MGKMTYAEQLKHPNWQRKRLEVMEAAGFECQDCGDGDTTLNVHHRRYVKGRMVWEYEPHELACLCEPCHRQQHERRELLDLMLLADDGSALFQAIGLLGGFLDGRYDGDVSEEAERIGDPYFDLGVLASMVLGHGPEAYVRIVDLIQPQGLSPSQRAAIERWRGFADALQKAGL